MTWTAALTDTELAGLLADTPAGTSLHAELTIETISRDAAARRTADRANAAAAARIAGWELTTTRQEN